MPKALMDIARIAELLAPYVGPEKLSNAQLEQIAAYLDLLSRWNARMNLTAVRDPEQIVTRHFGEAVFAARVLFPDSHAGGSVADVGSGAGFPGLPIAMVRPRLQVTLIEAHGKKATFLKEAVRATGLCNVRVLAIRAEACTERFDLVTFRAVEHFAAILPIFAVLVNAAGRLAALIGSSQVEAAKQLLGESWAKQATVNYPDSPGRTLWIAQRALPHE